MPEDEEPAHEQRIIDGISAHRMGDPREVAALTAFFASRDADYITGSIYDINGDIGYLIFY